MKNKKGFIATSLIYSFFLAFVTLFLTVVADYLQNKVLLNSIEEGIKTEVNAEFYAGDYGIGSIVSVVSSCDESADNYSCRVTENVDGAKKIRLECSDGNSHEVNFVSACPNSDGTFNKNNVMIK